MRKNTGTKVVAMIAGILIMSTIAGCGKPKESVVISEAEPVETEQEQILVEEPITEVSEPTPEPTSEVEESSEESSEEESLEELTVDMTKVKAFDVPKTMYAVSNVNIRKGPGTDFESVGKLKLGDPVEIIGQDADGWYEFMYKNEVAFACNDYLSEIIPAIPEMPDVNVQAVTAVPTVAPAAVEAVQTPAKVVTAPAGVLIIGDSRCVMMRDAVGGGNCSWICKEAKGYNWLESTAIPQADQSIGKGTKVVIALGVNDVGNVNNYAALINLKAAEWAARGAKTYYVSVNPVTENPYVTEEQVQYFNNTIINQLIGVRWIDTHSYLVGSGYRLVDGMHYDDETSIRIFQAIVGSLK